MIGELARDRLAGEPAARSNVDEVRLGDRVTVLAGDALATLADVPGPIGVVLLDGWKPLCLPVLRLLEP